jgi:hypothetical protein
MEKSVTPAPLGGGELFNEFVIEAHLRKYQTVGLLDLIEQKNAAAMFGQDFPQPSGAAGFVAHEQLHIVQVEKFGHIEPEYGIAAEKVSGEFQRQFRFPNASRPKEEK